MELLRELGPFHYMMNQGNVGDALIAASTINDDWQFTTTHSCIRTGCSHCSCLHLYTVPIYFQQHIGNTCPIAFFNAFLCNRCVVINLTLQNIFNII